MNELYTHEFKGWMYIHKPQKELKDSISIIPAKEKSVPEYLYKFYSLTPYNLDALTNNYIYASHSAELNDKFDCFEGMINYESATDQTIKDFLKNFDVGQEINKISPELRKLFKDLFSFAMYSGFGVISLTSKILNPLMWAHYSSFNHGFAVKFNHKYFHEKVLGPFPINYQKEWGKVTVNTPLLAFLYLTNIKYKKWKYEDEWRFIGSGHNMSFPGCREEKELVDNRKFIYQKEAVEEIILGNMFTDRLKKHFDEKYGTVVLALTPDVEYLEQKAQVLEFIANNKIKASYIYLDDENQTFALKQIGITLIKIDKYTYLMDEAKES